MTMYCFYQKAHKSPWILSLASERHKLVSEKGAQLITALDVNHEAPATLTAAELASVKQHGDLFFDFDEDLEVCIEQFKKFLVLLQSKGVELRQCRFYATGGRGFHAFVPMDVFMPKVSPAGVTCLVGIYKEMAHALWIDGMDGRIYSSKSGRMLRCTNVRRDNGRYKVPISAEEALGMTLERYAELTEAPRSEPYQEPPRFAPELGLLYSTSSDKVNRGLVKQKARKPSSEDLARFKGEWPKTLESLLSGEGLNPEAGWNTLSFQLALAAVALGKTACQLVADAEPLILSHKGDSSRYATPAKRRRDLREMYAYMEDNPSYSYAAGPLLALLTPEARARADIGQGEYVPGPPGGDGEGEAPQEDETGAVKIGQGGVFVRADDGYRDVCHLGITQPLFMRNLDGSSIGFEIDLFLDERTVGKKHLPMSSFLSKGNFNGWSLGHGASMRGTDVQVSYMADILRRRSKEVIFAVAREGIDIVTPPGALSTRDYEVIWSSPDQVVGSKGGNYRFHGVISAQGTFQSDLMNAPDLTEEDGGFVADLLSVNTDINVAKMLGWFCAAFLTQLVRKSNGQFPSLQIFGQAGAGKSESVILFSHLHYHLNKPKTFSVSGQTNFPMIAASATSASIPLVFEELKARSLTKTTRDFLLNLLRSNYTADSISRGSMGRDKAQRELTVTEFANAAPCVFVGEALEDQSAILERCVVVALSKSDKTGRDKAFDRCKSDITRAGRLGKKLAQAALSLQIADLRAAVDRNRAVVTASMGYEMAQNSSRPAYNLAVTLTGLDLLRDVLATVFGDRFAGRMKELREALEGNILASMPTNLSEVSRVLDTMAMLSRHSDPKVRLDKGVDYTLARNGHTLDLKLRGSFDKYVTYQRSLGMEVLFDTYNAWQVGLANYDGTKLKACPDNDQLFDSPRAVVYRISLHYLEKEGVDTFKP